MRADSGHVCCFPLRVLWCSCMQKSWKMTRNQDLNVLHVDNATAFVNGLQWRIIPNDTLLFDFVYFLHPVRFPSTLSAILHCKAQFLSTMAS